VEVVLADLELEADLEPEVLHVVAGRNGLEAQLLDMPWAARVRLQHRVARRFRSGPLFLAGARLTRTPRPLPPAASAATRQWAARPDP
jgi:hypothetical protein